MVCNTSLINHEAIDMKSANTVSHDSSYNCANQETNSHLINELILVKHMVTTSNKELEYFEQAGNTHLENNNHAKAAIMYSQAVQIYLHNNANTGNHLVPQNFLNKVALKMRHLNTLLRSILPKPIN